MKDDMGMTVGCHLVIFGRLNVVFVFVCPNVAGLKKFGDER
jgi:hypothetical protein